MKVLWGLLSCLPLIGGVIQGISLGSGLETDNRNIDCYWAHPPEYYIPQLKTMGFNYLRIPFSAQYINEGNYDVLDRFFSLAEQNDMKILLDFHRVWNSHQGDIFEINRDDFLNVWFRLLDRYKDRQVLTSVGLWNEYQGEDIGFWNGFLRDVSTQIETRYPNRFVFYMSGVRWAGSLNGMNKEDLYFSDRIKYEWHKYAFSSSNDWTHDWDWSVNAVPKEKIVIGEWGFRNPEDMYWANTYVDYLISKGIRDTFFWMEVQSSGDTGGLYRGDCQTIDYEKLEILKRLWGYIINDIYGAMRLSNPENYTLEGFEVNKGKKSKYDAILKNKKTGEFKRVPFGAKGYEQYHDKIGHYKDFDHGDKDRRKRYLQRHKGEDDYKFSSGYLSIKYLW